MRRPISDGSDPSSPIEKLSPTTRRAIRLVVGLGVAAGAVAASGALGFMGLWTYTGYKSAGDPGLGSLLYLAAIGAASVGGVALGWAFTNRRVRELRVVGAVFAAVAIALIFWVQSAN